MSSSVISFVLDVVGAQIESVAAARALGGLVDALSEARDRLGVLSAWPHRADDLLAALAHPQATRPRIVRELRDRHD